MEFAQFKQVLETTLTCKDIAMVFASKAVRSCQIWWIAARVEKQIEYIKVLKLWPEITLPDQMRILFYLTWTEL